MTPADLSQLLHASATAVLRDRGLDPSVLPDRVAVERPRNPEHGDYATNLAMQIGKKAGVNPRELAGWLAEAIAAADGVSEATVAGPGFLNIRLAADAQNQLIATVLEQGVGFGRATVLGDQRINLEFVSANPTGPVHLGGARWAAVGDSLGRVLEAQGAAVTREYYFNDHGAQIDRYARSLEAAATGAATPEDGYAGDYIGDIAATVVANRPGILELPAAQRLEAFRSDGVALMFDHIKHTLHEFGTDFDVFTHEDEMFADGLVDKCVAQLKESGKLYEADGAWWLRSTEYGDDKDRVVIKSDGRPAYIAGDIAYVKHKFDRGFTLAIYMLGADHHGYIARLRAAAAALGYDPDRVEVLIGQLVNLVREGEKVRMSKRAGTVITLDDLVEAVGVDAARYSLVRSSVDTSIDLDLDLLTQATNENPVYYVQYAHARLSAIARSAAALGIEASTDALGLLDHPREGDLVRTLGEYSAVVAAAATLREPHRVARYLEELAGTYHRFYGECRVLPMGDEQPTDLHRARVALCAATRQVLANGLALVGVSAPERM